MPKIRQTISITYTLYKKLKCIRDLYALQKIRLQGKFIPYYTNPFIREIKKRSVIKMKALAMELLDKIIEEQEIICAIYIKLNGNEHPNTKNAFARLDKYKSTKEKYINN